MSTQISIHHSNNYSTMQMGEFTVQTLTIDGEVYSPIRELLVALGITTADSVRGYMRGGEYTNKIRKSVGIELLYQLKFQSNDGKYYKTDSLNLKDIFKFIDILEPRNKTVRELT